MCHAQAALPAQPGKRRAFLSGVKQLFLRGRFIRLPRMRGAQCWAGAGRRMASGSQRSPGYREARRSQGGQLRRLLN